MNPADITVRHLLYLVGWLTMSMILLFAIWEIWIAQLWRRYDPADKRRWRYDFITHVAVRGSGWRAMITLVILAVTAALFVMWLQSRR